MYLLLCIKVVYSLKTLLITLIQNPFLYYYRYILDFIYILIFKYLTCSRLCKYRKIKYGKLPGNLIEPNICKMYNKIYF